MPVTGKKNFIHNNINDYIKSSPPEIQKLLEKIRITINKAAPGAEEVICYGIPTFRLNGNLVHFAAYKNHIGFYPAPSGIRAFQNELTIYKCSKGAVQFPVSKPIPSGLVSKIVKFRVMENLKKTVIKPKLKK
ncbi:MAG TPA: DUF1801 domain-containing protein [Chitinophagaceae bacterium]|nr:DUF1801 domain-containing protein [Chitinophagaceae bacterium]